ncbi:MAG: hypothetical protein PHF79_00680 [Candidatus Pacebacteria bacterium]|nr:hypothetical protein [Candidatus Paceibacterota bacterium]
MKNNSGFAALIAVSIIGTLMLEYAVMASLNIYQARKIQLDEIQKLQNKAAAFSCLSVALLWLAEDHFIENWPECVVSKVYLGGSQNEWKLVTTEKSPKESRFSSFIQAEVFVERFSLRVSGVQEIFNLP